MNAPWNAPKVSRLWSAKGDDRCSPPRSDDYKDWSLMQLKREITQRQLKTNPRRRNKDAFVRVLLSNDQEQTQQTQTQTENAPQTLEDPVLFVTTPTSELQNIYVNNEQQPNQDIYGTNVQSQQEVYVTNGGQPQQQEIYNTGQSQQDVYGDNGTQQDTYNGGQPQQQRQDMYMEHQQQQEVYTTTEQQRQNFMSSDVNAGVIQSSPLTTPAPAPVPQVQTQTQPPAPVASESEVETPDSFQATKKQRVEGTDQENEERENAKVVVSTEVTRSGTSAQHTGKGSTEYLRRKLSIQAAHLEVESRRLDLENKREQRNNELHVVQLALAKEQLQQAKMTTQKMKREWMVDQMIQKKRLNDAGITQEDSATLGVYMS